MNEYTFKLLQWLKIRVYLYAAKTLHFTRVYNLKKICDLYTFLLYMEGVQRCKGHRPDKPALIIGKQLKSLLASEASAWVKVCIFTNLYLCGCEPGIDKIADILDKAVRDGDFKVVWCVLYTLDELVTGGNEAFIKAMTRKVYSSLIPAQQEYIREYFFPDNKR